MENDLNKLEQFIGHIIPKSLKILLQTCGYNSLLSLKQISIEKIRTMEQFIQMNRAKILRELNGIDENAAGIYKEQVHFAFLPGHRNILLDFPKHIADMQNSMRIQSVSNQILGENVRKAEFSREFSHILNQMITTAEMNMNKKSKHKNEYTDDVKYFSTYIFLMCGRTCYETLSKNLPMPSTKTICKCGTYFWNETN